MIIVYDLDDTLYEEITFVKSGFKAVANYLSRTYKISSSEKLYEALIKVLEEEGRGKVFDVVLGKYKLLNKTVVRKCLTVYRMHQPSISLSKEGKACLDRFKDYPKYLVTDGNKIVQTNKIKALKIDRYFKRMVPTHRYGIKQAKPSTFCFHKILKWEMAEPKDLVYIGDNPKKDFVNLKKEGFRTIRVLTGEHKDVKMSKEFEADVTIRSLDDLTIDRLNKLINS